MTVVLLVCILYIFVMVIVAVIGLYIIYIVNGDCCCYWFVYYIYL